jgi:hypothetical protein
MSIPTLEIRPSAGEQQPPGFYWKMLQRLRSSIEEINPADPALFMQNVVRTGCGASLPAIRALAEYLLCFFARVAEREGFPAALADSGKNTLKQGFPGRPGLSL